MILLIDNYDSFTYNLVQYFGEMGEEVTVRRNDAITIRGIADLRPDHIVISPGPCTPREAGISVSAVRAYAGKIPILGVCLGHQCIGAAFGGKIVRADRLMHGKSSRIHHDGKTLFRGIPSPFEAIRYHSLVIRGRDLPRCLQVSAVTEEDEIMGVRHRTMPVEGVQFHPESIMTQHGKALLKNFLAGRARI